MLRTPRDRYPATYEWNGSSSRLMKRGTDGAFRPSPANAVWRGHTFRAPLWLLLLAVQHQYPAAFARSHPDDAPEKYCPHGLKFWVYTAQHIHRAGVL